MAVQNVRTVPYKLISPDASIDPVLSADNSGDVTIAGTGTLKINALTASTLVCTDANKKLSSAVTGLSPTFSGLTLSSAAATTDLNIYNTAADGDPTINLSVDGGTNNWKYLLDDTDDSLKIMYNSEDFVSFYSGVNREVFIKNSATAGNNPQLSLDCLGAGDTQLDLLSGTVQWGSIYIDHDDNHKLKIYGASAGTLIWDVARALKWQVNSDNYGRLVVENLSTGTSARSEILVYAGALSLLCAQYGTNRAMNVGGLTATGMSLLYGQGTNGMLFCESGNYPVYIATNNIVRVRVNNDGNVGIGQFAATTPAQLLEVEDNSATLTAIQISNTSTGDRAIIFADNGTEKARITNIDADGRIDITMNNNTVNAVTILQDGKIGIGTTAPTTTLTVNGTITSTAINVTGATASRLTAFDASKNIVSVSNLASWIAGTTNQITVTNDGDGTVTLATPQNIHTGASPTFVGLNLSGLTASRVLCTDGSKNISSDPSGLSPTFTGLTLTSAASTTDLNIYNSGVGDPAINLSVDAGTNKWVLSLDDSTTHDSFTIKYNAYEILNLDGVSGRVWIQGVTGIGSASTTSYLLEVGGTATTEATRTLCISNAQIGNEYAPVLRFQKSNHNAYGTLVETQVSDILGEVSFYGVGTSGSALQTAKIYNKQINTAGLTDIDSALVTSFQGTDKMFFSCIDPGYLKFIVGYMDYDTNVGFHNTDVIDCGLYNYSTNVNYYPQYRLLKSHTGTLGTKTATIDTEILGALEFYGVNSSSARAYGADIYAKQSGAAGATYIATDMFIRVGTNASAPTEVVTIKSDGKVGIGTTAPTSLFEVYSTGETISAIKAANNNISSLLFGDTDDDDVGAIKYSHVTNSFNFRTAAVSNRITFDSNGRVGINNTAPDGLLHTRIAATNNLFYMDCYSDTDAQSNYLYMRKSHNDTLGTVTETTDKDVLAGIVFQGVDTGSNFDEGAIIRAVQNGAAGTRIPTDLFLQTSAPTALRANVIVLKSDGKVGIGTATPIDALHLSGAAATDGSAPVSLRIEDTTNYTGWTIGAKTNAINFYSADASSPGAGVHAQIATVTITTAGGVRDLCLYTRATADGLLYERMRIVSTGKIGLGTATPATRIHMYDSTNMPVTAECGTAVTNAIVPIIRLKATSTGSKSGGFGPELLFTAQDTDATERDYVALDAIKNASGATASDFIIKVADGSTLTERLRIAYDGTTVLAGSFKATDYYSSDGSQGGTEGVAVAKVGGGTRTLNFKNGVYINYSDS